MGGRVVWRSEGTCLYVCVTCICSYVVSVFVMQFMFKVACVSVSSVLC